MTDNTKMEESPSKQLETLLPMKNQTKNQLKNNIHVSVRLKPLPGGTSEKSKLWRVIDAHHIEQINTKTPNKFVFDRVYGEEMGTKSIFDDHFKAMILQSIHGYNATIFAFG